MRKITQDIRYYFHARQAKKIGNTETDGNSVWLHGNEIIKRDSSGLIFWTLAGWNTPTTRERINGILDVGVHQKNFEPVLNGHTIDASDWFALEQGPACG